MSSGAHHARGQLVTPNEMVPWSVEVVSAVPKSIMNGPEGAEEPKKKKKKMTQHIPLDKSQINAGAVCPGWASLASWKGHIHVWHVSGSSSSASSSPSKQKKPVEPPTGCVTLYHPDLICLSEDANPSLIALTPASPDSVYVYACNPVKGMLTVWKVSISDVRRRRVEPNTSQALVYAQTKLPLERRSHDEDDDDDEVDMEGSGELEEFPSSLKVVDRHLVVLGTTKGALICCTQSTIPLALHSQRMLKTRSSRKSFLGGLISSFGGGDQDVGANLHDESSICFALPLSVEEEGCNEMLAVSLHGSIWHWKIKETVATNHKVETEARCVTTIATLFMQSFPETKSLSHLEILQTVLKGSRMHVLARTTEDSSEKLYWIVLRLEREGSKAALHLIGCQYLNRFPAPSDVEIMGLVLSEANGVAYAAFHQGSGGITSSVIIFCMATESDSDNTSSTGMTSLEIDLPTAQIPALLPGTFANDVVTHGVCVFARSGLGIRVRALPFTDTASALSPRAVKRANPSAVLKLTGHLRGAFWQAYQHQGTAADAPLPPSIVEAAPVDLEEAVIAVAAQFHTQRNTDSTGFSPVSSALEANPLEFHLALVTWLRRRGLYRHLSMYGKWRLLAFGMEIAAYLELISPTMSASSTPFEKQQVSSLKLSEVAHWLKQTLETTLRDGGTDHYQQWCGWFGTAMATAGAYRAERSGSMYDITSAEKPPPKIGLNEEEERMQRVPVWTSHPILQDVFGTLLQHWKAHPKQKSIHVLPPKTVEIIAKAALDSFADSAHSLSSDRAIGKYAEIKAMTIPLLRTLHPPTPQVPIAQKDANNDDILAFELAVRHDYYEGICQIALDHENKPDKHNFQLPPLLQSADQCQSLDQSGLTFGQFVLHWHTERHLFGHTITHGRACRDPKDLSTILKLESLRPYRWIQAVHNGEFQEAAAYLMGEDEPEKPPAVTLAETKWSSCMARLSNAILSKELEESQSKVVPDQAIKRDVKITDTLELVGVQESLMDGDLSKSQSGQHLWSASKLLSRALGKADQAQETEDATTKCWMGLVVCATFEDKATRQQEAARVWAKAISIDQSQWTEWIRTLDDLSSDALARTILETTVFGRLLQECAEGNELSKVAYNEFIENEVIQSLGFVQEAGVDAFRRVLFNVKTFVGANVGEEDEEMMDVQ